MGHNEPITWEPATLHTTDSAGFSEFTTILIECERAEDCETELSQLESTADELGRQIEILTTHYSR